MKLQDLGYLREQGFDATEIKQREANLRAEKNKELYIILPQATLKQWMTEGTIPPSYLENGTDEKHS
eukprot:32942-Amphidinium_carterae.1